MVTRKKAAMLILFSALGVAVIALLWIVLHEVKPVDKPSEANLTANSTTSEDEENFWRDIKDTIAAARVVLKTNMGDEMSLLDYPGNDEINRYVKQWKEFGYANLDQDTAKELLVKYFTGGAHCCDAYSVFRRDSNGMYNQFFTFEGGSGSLRVDGRDLIINFWENTGYFFTCYACSVEQELPDSTFEPRIRLRYDGQTFLPVTGDKVLNDAILHNLEFLSKRKIPDIDEANMDDGTRKEFAQLCIAWHFNNGMDIEATGKLFSTFYHAPDSKIVFTEIVNHISSILSMDYANRDYIDKINKAMKLFDNQDIKEN